VNFEWVNLETLAVVLGIGYLLLAMLESSLCWYCAFCSAALYVWISGEVSLYMASALNVYFMAMAIYGWLQWQRGGADKSGVKIIRWTARQHIFGVVIILGASVTSGYLLSSNTAAKLPYLDSFTTWGSVFTTIMVARKVLENWLYWIVINSVFIYLYIDRGLDLTAAMYFLYLVLATIGFLTWKKAYDTQNG
jgi:nicotinamide mononucleotide transporter